MTNEEIYLRALREIHALPDERGAGIIDVGEPTRAYVAGLQAAASIAALAMEAAEEQGKTPSALAKSLDEVLEGFDEIAYHNYESIYLAVEALAKTGIALTEVVARLIPEHSEP